MQKSKKSKNHCTLMSMLHVHVHTACHVHVNAAFNFNAAFHVNAAFNVNAAFHVNAAFYVNASCPCLCKNARMPDCPASGQSGTGLKKTNDAGTGSVPD
jgi:hypothetical protein